MSLLQVALEPSTRLTTPGAVIALTGFLVGRHRWAG